MKVNYKEGSGAGEGKKRGEGRGEKGEGRRESGEGRGYPK
jgi:hypothetical protein